MRTGFHAIAHNLPVERLCDRPTGQSLPHCQATIDPMGKVDLGYCVAAAAAAAAARQTNGHPRAFVERRFCCGLFRPHSVTHVLHELHRHGFIPAVFKARTRSVRETRADSFEGLYDSLTNETRGPPRVVSLSLGGESGACPEDEPGRTNHLFEKQCFFKSLGDFESKRAHEV